MVQLRGLPEVLYGSVEARFRTPPLCDITDEDNSYGYDVIRFAEKVLKMPLDPWQKWLVIRAGELLPPDLNGFRKPRFRQVVVLVSRQNGKTFLMQVLALYWLFVEQWPMIVGISTNLEYARNTLIETADIAKDTKALKDEIKSVLTGSLDISIKTTFRSKYKIAAATRKGPRSLRIDRLMVDELREQLDFDAYAASQFAMQARPYGQQWYFSNQGDDASVVLHMLREMALAYIDGKDNEDLDERLGLFEWSAPDGCDLMDRKAWAMANPNLGWRNDARDIETEAKKAKKFGGEVETKFRTESLCQRVRSMDSAVNPDAWNRNNIQEKFDDEAKKRLVFCFDISLDQTHATLCAAATLSDGRTRVVELEAWEGKDAGMKLRQRVPQLVAQYKPKAVGWFPIGPVASVSETIKPRPGVKPWLPAWVKSEEIRSEVADVCMGFSDLVEQDQVLHEGQALLTAHVLGTSRKHRSEGTWVFTRQGGGQCDAAYAAAGAVHLARTLPTPKQVELFSVKPQ